MGHSLVEEQEVGGVEPEVTLKAAPCGKVGQAAELGRTAAGHSLSSLDLPSSLDSTPPPRRCTLTEK